MIGSSLKTKSGLDPNAAAFISAAGITDVAEIRALNDLVLGYKRAGLWDKTTLLRPYRGNDPNTVRYNLKDPSTHLATLVNSPTVAFGGVTGNGTNSYVNQNNNWSTHTTKDNFRFARYIRNNVTGSVRNSGGNDGGGIGTTMLTRSGSNSITHRCQSGTESGVSGITDSRGLTAVNRDNSANYKVVKNGVVLSTVTNTSAALVNVGCFTLALCNNGGPANYSTENESFVIVGVSLTDAELAVEYALIQKFHFDLGISV